MEYNEINEYLVDIFNRVSVIEEMSLKTSQFNDVSLKEMHTIEIIGKYSNVTPSDIARELMLTLGTVTTSLNKLETKGYVTRTRSRRDRRVVYLTLTKKGDYWIVCIKSSIKIWLAKLLKIWMKMI